MWLDFLIRKAQMATALPLYAQHNESEQYVLDGIVQTHEHSNSAFAAHSAVLGSWSPVPLFLGTARTDLLFPRHFNSIDNPPQKERL